MIPLLATLSLISAPSVVVAAIQYPGDDASIVDQSCKSAEHRCAIESLVRQAAARGAKLVVAPEYAFSQKMPAPDPKLGPLDDDENALLQRFSRLAKDLAIYLVINLETTREDGRYNTQVAYDPAGTVAGTHHKFELFGEERSSMRPGRSVSVVRTPFGNIGMLICADLYGDPRLHAMLTEDLGASIIAVSSWWTVPDATAWPAAFARDWEVYVIAANGSSGQGRGGGIFAPDGSTLTEYRKDRAQVIIATIPLPTEAALPPKGPGTCAP